MTANVQETSPPPQLEDFMQAAHPMTGTDDDADDRDDERADENEAGVREVDENTEAPEEFKIADEAELGHPEDDDAAEEQL
jgi:hypothetical protein